jgi:hypothetical protein
MDAAQINGNLAEIEGQSRIEQKPTVDLRLCQACSAEMRNQDRFCRRCGVRQTGEISPPQENTARPACDTSRLQADAFRSLSASLLTAVAEGAQAGTARLNSSCARSAVSFLILIPLWLMIVLLSPFDAYATAKAIAGHPQAPYRNFGDWPGNGRSSPRVL